MLKDISSLNATVFLFFQLRFMKPLKLSATLYFAALVLFFSCKKNNEDLAAVNPSNSSNSTVVSPDIIKDSALIISKDIYLWNTQIPLTLNARNFENPAKLMEGLRPFSLEGGFAQPVDRWSFAMKKTEWDEYSGGISGSLNNTDVEGDFGLTVFFKAPSDLRVRLTEPFSPAGTAGIHRGWRIISINGNTNITTTNADFIIQNIYNSNNSTIGFIKPDGTAITINLTAAHYNNKPVYLDTVYQLSGKRIGYLVLNSFLGNQAQLNSDLQRVFSHFSSQSVTDVIVDLRYNGGGYVSIQETLANYLVNSSANGQLMMKQIYNSNNSENNRSTNFRKLGQLNLSKVYFITTNSTASASELLINNLKPYMDVRLVGTKTHGKPVGFFSIPVGDWYIFPVSFRTTNKNAEGNYFNGLPVNSQVADGLDKDWGNINETSLASAINNIVNGSYRVQAEPEYIDDPNVSNGNLILDQPFLKISIKG